MKQIFLTMIICAALCLAGCQKAETTSTTPPANALANNENPAQPNDAGKDASKVDPNLQATFPFKDYPAVETTAKTGESVLVPSYNWLQEATANGVDKRTMIWYAQKMSAPDKEMSEVEFMREKRKVPNAYIIPLPAGGKAKKGDIVLTWWQSGSGMNRAIVVDDANPAEPVVRYLDIAYDNPSKSRDGKSTIGQMDEQLKPNTFVKINAPLEPGTSVIVTDTGKQRIAQVINVAGNKVFVKTSFSKLAVFDKSACTSIPVTPGALKQGDKVKAPSVGVISEATVTKVDEKIGRVFVKFGNSDKEEAVAFGEVMK